LELLRNQKRHASNDTPSHPVVDKSVERIVEDVSTDVDVSDAMRPNCNNDGSSGEAANVD
ncbi:hypothetical protein Tco_1333966, partial [Tanacetum coccineum]